MIENGLSPAQIIVDIIANYMELDDQLVFIEDKNHNIPTDDGMIISVRTSADSKVVSSTNEIEEKTVDNVVGQYETSSVTMRENVTIEAYSSVEGYQPEKDVCARRWEIVAALGSIYSQQKQDENFFKIFKVPTSFLNTSAAEGGSQLARYTLSFAIMVCYKKSKLLSTDGNMYYEEFETRVDDEETIGEDDGLFEFTLDENTEL